MFRHRNPKTPHNKTPKKNSRFLLRGNSELRRPVQEIEVEGVVMRTGEAIRRFQNAFARGDKPTSEFYLDEMLKAPVSDKDVDNIWKAMEAGIKEWKGYIPTAKERNR